MIILAVIVIILLTILIVWLVDKFVPKKGKPFIIIGLWVLIAFLAYITYMSVYQEIKFNQLKDKRYRVVIEQLKDIRDAQLTYKEVNGEYAANFDALVKFIDTAQVPITQRRDITVLDEEKTRLFGGVETFATMTLIDTLDYFSVKDSLFGGTDSYKNIMNVAVGKDGSKFKLQAGKLDEIPVFEASIDKAIVLDGEDKYLIEKEKQKQSIAGVKGPTIKVGSMQEINTNGNWGKDLSKDQ